MNTFTGTTPDITAAQIGSLLTFIGGQAVAFGWLTEPKEQTLISVGSIVIAAVWKIADAMLRGSRAKAGLTPTHRPAKKQP